MIMVQAGQCMCALDGTTTNQKVYEFVSYGT